MKSEQIYISPVCRAVDDIVGKPFYAVLMIADGAEFAVDFTDYTTSKPCLLFLSPYQAFRWKGGGSVRMITFHGDFYCIEYHKKEVACNGILFNNIYLQPYVEVSAEVFSDVESIVQKLYDLQQAPSQLDVPIIRTYLQLVLALASKQKQLAMAEDRDLATTESDVMSFNSLLESNFVAKRAVSFYAGHYHLTVDAFSKKVKRQFGKTPSKLIQERLVLEAKKLLHLTHKSVKEIATELNFEDEFYFSRYFKKEVGVSPKKFREEVGISIVAKK